MEIYGNGKQEMGVGLLEGEAQGSAKADPDGQAEKVLHLRQQTLSVAYLLHPERFVRKAPSPALLPEAVWINPPQGSKLGLMAENGVGAGKTELQDRVGPNFSEPDDLNIVPKSDRNMVSCNPETGTYGKEVTVATLN